MQGTRWLLLVRQLPRGIINFCEASRRILRTLKEVLRQPHNALTFMVSQMLQNSTTCTLIFNNLYLCSAKYIFGLKLNKYCCWMKLFLKFNDYFCWMKLFLVEAKQIFLLNGNNLGWSWKTKRIVEYKMLNVIYLAEHKYKLLNMNVQVVEFCNIWLTIVVGSFTFATWRNNILLTLQVYFARSIGH